MADVEFKVENSVLWITLNRPEQMGALTSAMRDEIIQRLLAARTDLAVRAAVLTGRGKGFCTGADLSRPAGAPASTDPPTVGAGREMMKYGSQLLLRTIWEFEKPFIAAVNGTAAGLGAHLAFACDLIIAAAESRFIEVFVRRGLMLDAGGAYLLPRLIGLAKAKELVFFGEDLKAEDALAIGLVNKVVPGASLEATAREWAEKAAQGPTFAIGMSKRLLNRSLESDLETSLDEEGMAVSLVTQSEDTKEGMMAFAEKRKPVFKGR